MKGFPLLPRQAASDKFSYGHVLIWAGSRQMPGAAILTGRAALFAGSGLTTLATDLPEKVWSRLDPEIMRLRSTSKRILSKYIRDRRVNVIAVGPGLGRRPAIAGKIRKFYETLPLPLVVDADGLNAFAGHRQRLKAHSGPRVLTPHRYEFTRLFGVRWPSSPKARRVLAKKLSKFYDVVLVLKGHQTLVVYKDQVYRNTTGNPGMAKGGCGDVLTGIIAAFIAQGLTPFEAARWGVYIHGKAGDVGARRKGQMSLTATDIIDALPKVLR